jgi:hypothetical protein
MRRLLSPLSVRKIQDDKLSGFRHNPYMIPDMRDKMIICHFPPGASKWNKIEHRLFSFITQNWRGKPLLSRQAVVELIGSTRTGPGLVAKAALDTNQLPHRHQSHRRRACRHQHHPGLLSSGMELFNCPSLQKIVMLFFTYPK